MISALFSSIKKFIVVYSVLLFVFFSCKKNPEISLELKNTVSNYLQANNKGDFKTVATYIYPSSMKQIGGEKKFVEDMTAFSDNSVYSFSLNIDTLAYKLNKIEKFDEKDNTGKYSIGRYTINQTIRFKDNSGQTYHEFLTAYRKQIIIKSAIVEGDSVKNEIYITEPKYFAAINDKTTAGKWKILNFVPAPQIEELFPKKILEELKSTYSADISVENKKSFEE